MTNTKLFLHLSQEKKSEVTDTLLNIGLCMVNHTSYNTVLSKAKSSSLGKLNKLYTNIASLTESDLDRLIGYIVPQSNNTLHLTRKIK